MIKTEEIRLHNLFIKFKNEGKGIDEIKGLLEVDGKVLERWDKDFEVERKKIFERNIPVKTEITGIGENGIYSHQTSFSIEMSVLNGAKFTLQRVIASINEGQKEQDFQIKAKEYLPIFERYFIDLIVTNFDENTQTSNIDFTLNTNDKSIIKIANKAVKFWHELYITEKGFYDSFLVKEPSGDIFKNAKEILKYSLKRIIVKNYDGVKFVDVKDVPIDTNWIFLIGENGFGKTTILRSISIGFIGEKDEESELFNPDLQEGGIGIEYFNLSQSFINNVGQNTFTLFPHLACYGPSRLQIQTDQTQNDIAKKSTTTYSLFNSDGILLNIEFELLIWHLEKNPRFDAVKQTFLKLIPYLSDIQVDVPQRKIFYIEKEPTENGSKYNRVTFNQLASGFRSILAMVGDMMIRLFKSQPEITEPSELAGIVIIDELDLHWHPKMQREIPSLLSSIFPKVQFIASTHSLVPLLGAPENSVLLKVNRTVEEGIIVEKVDIDFQALSSDTMLRDIFDLEEYMSDPKIRAWERYTKLKGLIHFEKDEAKKNEYIHEREILGDKYNFTL